MLKSELIDAIRSRTGLSKKDVESAINALFDVIEDSLVLGERVDVHGFGRFEARKTRPRMVRHPSSRRLMTIPARTQVSFRPSECVVRAVNGPLKRTT